MCIIFWHLFKKKKKKEFIIYQLEKCVKTHLNKPLLGPLPRHQELALKDQLQASCPLRSPTCPHTPRFSTLSHLTRSYRAAGWRAAVWGAQVWSHSGLCGKLGVSPRRASAAEGSVSPANRPLNKTEAGVSPLERRQEHSTDHNKLRASFLCGTGKHL